MLYEVITVNVQSEVADTLLSDPLIDSVGAMSGIDLATFASYNFV